MVSKEQLRKIIQEELQRVLLEDIDADSVKKIVNVSSHLLKALQGFKSSATPEMLSSTSTSIDELTKHIENMVQSPASYVPKPIVLPRTIKLRRSEEE